MFHVQIRIEIMQKCVYIYLLPELEGCWLQLMGVVLRLLHDVHLKKVSRVKRDHVIVFACRWHSHHVHRRLPRFIILSDLQHECEEFSVVTA